MSDRIRRVNEAVRAVVAEALGELKDPRIGMVTVTGVSVGVFVRDYEKTIVRGERGKHTFQVSRRLLLRLLCHL
jgi:hypothetical protein